MAKKAAKKVKTKWRWNEFDEWKDEKEVEQEPAADVPRSGQCSKCNRGKFTLSISKGRMDRTCKNCGEVTANV